MRNRVKPRAVFISLMKDSPTTFAVLVRDLSEDPAGKLICAKAGLPPVRALAEYKAQLRKLAGDETDA